MINFIGLQAFEINDGKNAGLINASREIITRFYATKSNDLNFVEAYSTEKSMRNSKDIIDGIMAQTDGEISIIIERYDLIKKLNYKRTHNIFFVDNAESFRKILAIMNTQTFFYQGYYLVVLTTNSKNRLQEIKKIFKLCWKNKLTRVSLLVGDSKDNSKALLYTYFPFKGGFCGNTDPIIISRFAKNKFSHYDFIPPKTRNYQGCLVRFAAKLVPPFFTLSKDSNGKFIFGGVEGKLLKYIADYLNFTVVPKLLKFHDEWGLVSKDGTKLDVLKWLLNDEADISYSVPLNYQAYEKYEIKPSRVFDVFNLLWVIPPGRHYTSFEKLFQPFDLFVWICFLLIFLAAIIAVFILKGRPKIVRNFILGRDVRTPILNLIGLSLGVTAFKVPGRNFARTLLMIYILYMLVLRTAYQGALFKSLQMDLHQPAPKSISEMIDKDFKFHLHNGLAPQANMIGELNERYE